MEARWPGALFWRRRRAPEVEGVPITLDPLARLVAAPGAPPEAFAAAEGILPPPAVAWLAAAAGAPVAAHELLAGFKARGLARVSDRALVVALQRLVEDGAFRAAPTLAAPPER
jgi:hypothetical protein